MLQNLTVNNMNRNTFGDEISKIINIDNSEAKKIYLKYFNKRVDNFKYNRGMQLESINTNLKCYIGLAKKYSNNYRLSSEKRNKLKKIVKRFKLKMSEDQAINLFLILRHELKNIRKV